ncbi:MAG: hypothetical protein QF915_05030 [Candidatus Woesearchaeota archaeon]|jgi:uncharacterized protein (UPF0332 family)|nr:hypothetical protein [Candidatus Woesearchaeota archaeon]|tara:strand:- start:952 stop:1272 length:321 start_codon:yes stop_codon:yes gene_type:complete
MKSYNRVFSSAELVFKNQDYTSATILFFKTIFVALDHMIQKRVGRTPKDHTERFRILQKEFPEYYTKLDVSFTIYRDTYTKTISKEVCEDVKNEAEFFIAKAEKSS